MEHVDTNVSTQSPQVETVPEINSSTQVTRPRTYKGLVILLLILVLGLIGFIAYMFFTNKLDLGIENPFSQQVTEENTINEDGDVQEETQTEENQEPMYKTGQFHLTMSYPSEFVPESRVCFTSEAGFEVYCFVDTGTQGTNSVYVTHLEDGTGTLPVGKYTMEYRMLDGEDYYIWNPCVKELNGYELEGESKCTNFYTKLGEAIDANPTNFNLSSVNSYGGDPIVIDIVEGKLVEIGIVPLMPYFNLEML